MHTNIINEFGESSWRKERRQKRREKFIKIIVTIILVILATISLTKLYIAFAEVNELKNTMTTKELRNYLYLKRHENNPYNK